MRILEEIGIDVMHDRRATLLAEAGQKVDGDRVCLDRGLRDGAGREGAAYVPAARAQPRARTPSEVGGGAPLWMNVGGPPFSTDLDEGRRSGTHRGPRHDREADAGHRRAELRAGGRVRGDRPADGDPPHGHGVLGDPVVGQAVHHLRHERSAGARRHQMAEIVHGGRDAIEAEPALMGIVNPNSPADLGLPDGRRA